MGEMCAMGWYGYLWPRQMFGVMLLWAGWRLGICGLRRMCGLLCVGARYLWTEKGVWPTVGGG